MKFSNFEKFRGKFLNTRHLQYKNLDKTTVAHHVQSKEVLVYYSLQLIAVYYKNPFSFFSQTTKFFLYLDSLCLLIVVPNLCQTLTLLSEEEKRFGYGFVYGTPASSQSHWLQMRWCESEYNRVEMTSCS